jgi:hypothetical protein
MTTPGFDFEPERALKERISYPQTGGSLPDLGSPCVLREFLRPCTGDRLRVGAVEIKISRHGPLSIGDTSAPKVGNDR